MSDLWNYQARFIRAIDGDTIEVDIDLGFDLVLRKSVRLAGVNTPERGQPGYAEAKEYVQTMLSATLSGNDFPLRLRTLKVQEKYGRYLAAVDISLIAPGITDLSEILIKNGLGKEYHGGAR